MNTLTAKNFTIFVIPAVLLAATFWFMPRVPELPPARLELLPHLPYPAIALGAILSIHFHRGRALFVFLLLAVSHWSFQGNATELPRGIEATVLYQSVTLLVPLNIALLSLMRERGIVTVAGRIRFAFLGLQALLVWWAMTPGHVAVQQLLAGHLSAAGMVAGSPLPPPAIPAIVLSGLLVAARAGLKQSPVDSAFLGALMAFAVAGNGIDHPHVTPIFMTAAAVILSLGVLKDSYNMAFRDELTGLPSRRALSEQLTWLGRRYSVAMVDVDHFKKFNDTYGHDVGDQVLRLVAAKLRGVGGGGKAYRYGGEEFTILFPHRSREEVLGRLEELRRAIADYRMRLRSSDRPASSREGKRQRSGTPQGRDCVSVTISIGVAESSSELRRPADVIKAADDALYRAKGRGRNQVST
ncbi:GGDEF domain-containing protein [Geobacter sulfurreducens subsp. ethanolicus]|uniref:GGDEF domain-containing protein n=1 Tax=Geobacter sulfurreducens TaxID=35554 RepID=UPI00257282C2|nr:GGDEF domain-containing protein [Geobacter sulfurreducens]BEH09385.1 GGDEF domain-containing protein [Geobacter sulfurreducens subsp. ethanolicus]